jgi:hypothetical protein
MTTKGPAIGTSHLLQSKLELSYNLSKKVQFMLNACQAKSDCSN